MDKSVEEEAGGGADCHAQKHGHWITSTPIANPMSGYAAYKMSRKSWGIDAIGSLIVGKIQRKNQLCSIIIVSLLIPVDA